MLENVNQWYGYGQQSYAMHQESYDMQNEYQNHVSGMQIMPRPFTDSPQHSKPMMLSGNYAQHQDGCHGKNKYQNGWNGQNMHQNGWSSSNVHFNHAFGGKFPPPGAFNGPHFPHGHMSNGMMVNAEYETYNTGPAIMRMQATRFQHGSWDNNGFHCQSFNEGGHWTRNGHQDVDEWKSLD